MIALARTIAEQLQVTARQIEKNIIYARIDELDEQTLDVLAYDLHVDWYDYSYPIEVKRQTIKDSVKVHRKLGTKYAVETALGAVYPGTKVQEWFEYEGQPHHFHIVCDVSISYEVKKETTIHVAAVHSIGTRLEVYPYLAKDIAAAGTVHVAAAVKAGTRLEVFPVLVKSMTERATVRTGAVVKTGTKVEIFPAYGPA